MCDEEEFCEIWERIDQLVRRKVSPHANCNVLPLSTGVFVPRHRPTVILFLDRC